MPAPVPARGLERIAMGLDDRTSKALGDKVMERLRSLRFCIVGCGGTGANFAEMLVRTGATGLWELCCFRLVTMWVTSLGLAGEAGIFASRPFYPMFSGVPNGPLRLSPPQVHAAVHNSGIIPPSMAVKKKTAQ